MSSNWPKVRLGDFCLKIGSGSTPRGGKDVYLESGEVALIRSQNIYNDGFKSDGLAFIASDASEKLKSVEVKPEDILLNITGDSVARVCLAPEDYLPARVNQHVAIIRPDPEEFDARYVRYFLVAPKQQRLLHVIASSGATRNALTKAHIESLEIDKPDIKIQILIADQLDALDKKIKINESLSGKLGQIAESLFKSWFVDFSPTKAKIAVLEAGGTEDDGTFAAMSVISGKNRDELSQFKNQKPEQYGCLLDMARLFPSSMIDWKSYKIPSGWQCRPLDEIAHYQNGLALQKFRPKDEDNYLPVVKISQLKKGFADGEERASPDIKPECIIDDGDVVFSWSGTLFVDLWCGGRAALNQHLFKVTSAHYPKWFYLQYTLLHLEYFQRIAADKAVTMGHINRHHLSSAFCTVPDNRVLSIADKSIAPLVDMAINLRLESKKLQGLRDALLPKLLSGELSVGSYKKEEAA